MATAGRRGRLGSVAVAVLVSAVLAVACVPPPTPPPPTTTTTTSTTTTTAVPVTVIPGFTYQLPSFSLDLPSVGVGFSGCNGTYDPPSVNVTGPVLSIPETTVVGATGVVQLPGVSLQQGAASLSLGTVTISCLISFSSSVRLDLGSAAATPSATVDLGQGSITTSAVTLSLSATLVFTGFGGLTIPLANQNVTIPGVTIPIPFN